MGPRTGLDGCRKSRTTPSPRTGFRSGSNFYSNYNPLPPQYRVGGGVTGYLYNCVLRVAGKRMKGLDYYIH
jgi:hypothetical protein